MQAKLSLATIGELDNGSARLVVNDAISKAVSDLDDRGTDGKPRQVVVLITMQRLPDSDAVSLHLEAEAKLPKRRTGNTLALVKAQAGGEIGALFQTGSPQDPYQKTIDELEGGGARQDS